MDPTTVHVLLVVFFATLIRSTFGFGEGLIAVPLLALTIPLDIAAPLVVLLSIPIAAVVVAQDWQRIRLRTTGWLLAPTFLGIPLGIALLTRVHPHIVKAVLAIVIVAFSGYFLLVNKPPALNRDSHLWTVVCGFFAGVLGGAYGMNGPPLVIYGAMRRWSPQHFRATLQGYFLPASVIAMAGYWFAKTLGFRGHALLSDFSACRASGHISWQGSQSSPARRHLSQVCSRCPGRPRSSIADPGAW